MLLVFAALLMLVLIPTAFASNADDACVVGVNNQSAMDGASIDATDDSSVLEANDYETNVITAANDVTYVDGFDGSGGSGTSDNPYHSLKDVLNNSVNSSNEIYLLPGTYDFGNTTIGIYDKDFTLNAIGDVVFTSSETLFNKYGTDVLTLNGIQFRDITSSSSAILYTGSSVEGTLILNNCSFINNKGANLIDTSYNIYVKGCTFIDNEATGTTNNDGGLIDNIFGSPIINISYSIFIGNIIRYSNNGFNPIIVNGIGDPGPSVYFDYNFVDNNNPLTQDEIIANRGVLNSYSNANLAVTVPADASAGSTVDFAVNFTKSDGSALDDCMPNLTVALVPAVNVASIPVTITNNGGKGQYVSENRGYTENIDVKYDEKVLNTFEFYVAYGGLLNPQLNVPASMTVDMGASVNMGAVHLGDGTVSYAVADESVVTVDDNGVVTGVGEGITTVTVAVAATDTYGEDSRQVTLMVKDPADANVIYVDGFDESDGGSGIKVDPYHSLLNVLVSANSGKEIRLLPGTYHFTNTIDLKNNEFVLNACGDVIFTSFENYMFKVNEACDVTFNGIKFEDSIADGSVITRTFSSAIGTLNFYYCDFINNTGDCLIKSSCNLNIKGCNFIDNKATGTGLSNAGLINNYYASTNTINIGYSTFINNEISYNNNGNNPIVVDWNNGNGPAVIFNYNFVNGNSQINNDKIAYHARITKGGNAIITAAGPAGDVCPVDFVDLVVNFTKSDGSALNDYMPNLTVSFVPTVNAAPISAKISKNGGKGYYIADNVESYTETIVLNVYGIDLTTFEFNVVADRNATRLTVKDVVANYNSSARLYVYLKDANGDAISGVKVNLVLGTINKTVRTDSNGRITAGLKNLDSGNYTAFVSFAGNDDYYKSNATANVFIKAQTIIIAPDVAANYNSTDKRLYVKLTDGEGNIITGVKVNVVVGDIAKTLRTDAKGKVSVSLKSLDPGNYTAMISYAGNGLYSPSSATANVFIKAKTVLIAKDMVTAHNDSSRFYVSLKDVDGNPISGVKVNLVLGTINKTVKTDSKGRISASTKSLALGNHTAFISCLGNELYSPSTATANVLVKAKAILIAEDMVTDYNASSIFNVTLKDADGNPIAGVNVHLVLGTINKTVMTDSEGRISASTKNLASGNYTARITFDGTEVYAPSSTSASVVVNGIPTVLTAKNIAVDYNTSYRFYVSLKDVDGNPISGVKVNLVLGTINKTVRTDAKGRISASTKNLDRGNYTAMFSCMGTEVYASSNSTANVVIR